MLPFLKPAKKQDGIATYYRAPDEDKAEDAEKDSDLAGLEAAAKDLHTAIESQNFKAMAAALKAAFEILESAPHREGPHTEE